MKGDPIPGSDHVARFCDRKYISESDGVEPGAFMLRKAETYLSVQWLEHLEKPTRKETIRAVREIFSKHLKVRHPAKLAVLNVETTRTLVAKTSGYGIRLMHQPEPDNEAHSGIFDTDQNADLIAELILETIQEIHPAIESNMRVTF